MEIYFIFIFQSKNDQSAVNHVHLFTFHNYHIISDPCSSKWISHFRLEKYDSWICNWI